MFPVVPIPTKRRITDAERGGEKRLKFQHIFKPEINLLDLPKEVLCLIARKFPNRGDVLNLALSNTKALETLSAVLAAEIKVTIPTAWKILERLCVSPKLARKVTYLDLTDFECPHPTQPCSCIGMVRYLMRDGIRQGSLTAPTYVWLEPQAAFLQNLISFCPNLKSLAIELPNPFKFDAYYRRIPQGGNMTPQRIRDIRQGLPPIPPFEGKLLADLQEKLEMLVVTDNNPWQGPHNLEDFGLTRWRKLAAHTLTFPGFSRLKSLDVLMTSLEHPRYLVFGDASGELIKPHHDNKSASNKQFVLPRSLTYLRLRSCNAFIFVFLLRVVHMPPDKLKLKNIEIDMNCCAQSLIIRCHNADEGRYSYEILLDLLKKQGIVVTWNAGNVPDTYNRRVDMVTALRVFYSLNPDVLWRKTRWASENFPDAKARVALGPQEQPQQLVHNQSFYRGVPVFTRVPIVGRGAPFQPPGMSNDPLPVYVHLLNSPRFNALAWVDVAIFHATVDRTDELDRVSSDKREIAIVWRHRTKGKPPKLYDLYRYQFSFRVHKTLHPPMAKFHFFGATYDQPAEDSRAPRPVYIHKVEEVLFDMWYNKQRERLRKEEERRREQGEIGLERAFATFVSLRGDIDVKIHCTHVSQLRRMRFDASQWMHLPWGTILHPWDEDFNKEP
ncbi:hypothetical protein IQ07DRAFT_384938 [Pyrenochaeta sp. DS3sAY3a]|nr:hypothetical protein IQ07DRAFT_384938 [Pyrenochaeta sp. DS3sAY3a]